VLKKTKANFIFAISPQTGSYSCKGTLCNAGISSKTTDQDQIARYRSLLLGEMDEDEEKNEDKDVDMEITWEPNLDEIEEEVGC